MSYDIAQELYYIKHLGKDYCFRVGDRVDVRKYGKGIVISPNYAVSLNSTLSGNADEWVYVYYEDQNITEGHKPHVITLITPGPSIKEEAPRNNDGRDKCYWCQAPTKEYIGLFQTGHICSKCGK